MNVFEYLDYDQYKKVIKIIKSGKFDINSTDKNGHTLLMNCCSTTCTSEEQEIIDLLLSKNVNVNVNYQDEKFKYNALMLSFEINRFDVSKKLLPYTDIFAVNSEGKYALTLAVYHGRKDLIELVCTAAKSMIDVNKLREHLILKITLRINQVLSKGLKFKKPQKGLFLYS